MKKENNLLVYKNQLELERQENRELRSIIIDLQLENRLIRKLLLGDEKGIKSEAKLK